MIISGGQSGVDRAALDAALACGLPYGGWCPADGWAEDYPTPPGLLRDYPRLIAAPAGSPALRTRLNVRDSTATAIFTAASVSPGTQLTIATARKLRRPHLVVRYDAPDVTERLREFLAAHPHPVRLNVAGPRASTAPEAYAAVFALLVTLFGPVR